MRFLLVKIRFLQRFEIMLKYCLGEFSRAFLLLKFYQ